MSGLVTIQLSVREIERYAHEFLALIASLPEEQIWSKKGGIPNSIGTLARHLTGNLNHYLGAGILKNGYARGREREFTETNLPKEKIISDLQAAVQVAKQAAEEVDVGIVDLAYKAPSGEEFESLAYHVVRLATHFALHCGQADYAKNCTG